MELIGHQKERGKSKFEYPIYIGIVMSGKLKLIVSEISEITGIAIINNFKNLFIFCFSLAFIQKFRWH